jgi:hypothetical protein
MPDHRGGTCSFSGIWRRDSPPGRAASWLPEQFVALGTGDVEEPGFGRL